MQANIIGATGLTGVQLLRQLLENDRFEKVRVFVRRPLATAHPKLEVCVIDFDRPETWRDMVQGDVLFSALGTTLQQAGGKAAQYRVDYEYQYAFAEAAAQNGVPRYVLVSSVGAKATSRNFYTQMKGALDEAVQQLPFQSISILRPGFLDGQREQKRPGEAAGLVLMRALGKLPFMRNWRPIPVQTVAVAMVQSALAGTPGSRVYTLGEVFELGESQNR
jgi:uncharacterized protein YbjT (DUF2867 family)